MIKRLLDQHPTASLVVATTVASLVSSWLLAISSGGMAAISKLTSLEMLPRVAAALLIVGTGVLLSYVMMRLARVSSNVVVTADGPSIQPEQLRLLKIVEVAPATEEKRSAQQALDDLDAMIGLMPVKKEVNTLIARLQLERRRRDEGMKVSPVTQHMIFTGPPGVGKTEVARVVGDIFRGLGVLKRGQLIETQRRDFIGQWIGHTAEKTLDVCNKALDGILFIDEAYSLVIENSTQDFGREAIDALIKFMEDNRDRVIVIVAGYPDKMRNFLEANEGLGSRFAKTISFPSYSSQELSEILFLMASSQGFKLPAGYEPVIEKFVKEYGKSKYWGNGRSMRNLLDKLREAQAVRLSHDINSGGLDEFTEDDLKNATEMAAQSL